MICNVRDAVLSKLFGLGGGGGENFAPAARYVSISAGAVRLLKSCVPWSKLSPRTQRFSNTKATYKNPRTSR